LNKVRENKTNDDTRVNVEVTSIHEHDYNEVDDALKDKYLLEGGAMYVTKHTLALDAIDVAPQVYSSDIEKCHRLKASLDRVNNFFFYKAPLKTNLYRTTRVSPNTTTKSL
jgi:hypothetical protein